MTTEQATNQVREETGPLHYGGHEPAGTYHALFDSLRDDAPLIRTSFGTGFWVATRHEDILGITQNPTVFSSRSCIALEPDPPYKWIPIMSDPPEHTQFRRLMSSWFTPKRAQEMTPQIRERCVTLLNSIVGRGECEFVAEFAAHYPTSIFMDLMGMPEEDFDQFMAWENTILHGTPESDPDRSKAFQAMLEVGGYFADLLTERRESPRDDFVSFTLTWDVDGVPVAEDDLVNLCLTMFLAGLDTVTAQLSYTFLHLATHPEHRGRIVTDPSMIPSAVEESLRLYTILTTARVLTEDVEIDGCPIKAKDIIAVPYCSANRDPDVFPDPQQFDLDRPHRPHVAFGAGPHRCIGSHLGRQELIVALEEWHKRIPDYRVAAGTELTEHGGNVLGLEALPLEWSAKDGIRK